MAVRANPKRKITRNPLVCRLYSTSQTFLSDLVCADGQRAVWKTELSVVGLLSQPYAVSQGGWLSLVILLIGTLLCQCTAKFVLNVTDQFLQRRPDGVPSYAEIGREAFGTWGYIISSTVVLLEISLAACISLVFVWNNVLLLFTESWQVSYAVIAAIATAATLPSVWIRNFSRISFIAIFGTFASIGVFIVVVVVFLLDPTVIRVNEYDFFKVRTKTTSERIVIIFITLFCVPVSPLTRLLDSYTSV